jgi:hypothetical protein
LLIAGKPMLMPARASAVEINGQVYAPTPLH